MGRVTIDIRTAVTRSPSSRRRCAAGGGAVRGGAGAGGGTRAAEGIGSGEGGRREEKSPLEHVLDPITSSCSSRSACVPSASPPCSTTTWAARSISSRRSSSLLELLAAVIVAALSTSRWRGGCSRASCRPAGRRTLREVLLTFVRDDIARPAIGEHDADKYVPFLWTLFLFILFNNLLGLIPFFGSATGNIYVTGGLALCVFVAIHGSAVRQDGLRPIPRVDVAALRRALRPRLRPQAADLRHRVDGRDRPQRRAGRASVRQHVRRARRAGDDPDLHLRGGRARTTACGGR